MHSRITALILFAASVSAQNSTSDGLPWPTISPCGLNCLQNAQGCTSYTDVSCVCSNSMFQNTVAACIQANCPRSDLAAALALQAAQCAGGGPWSSSSQATSGTSVEPTPVPTSSSGSSGSSSQYSPTSDLSSTPVGTSSPISPSSFPISSSPSSILSPSPSPSSEAGGDSDAAIGRIGKIFTTAGVIVAAAISGAVLFLH